MPPGFFVCIVPGFLRGAARPKRLVVDVVVLRRLEASIPIGRGTLGAFHGVPIFVDDVIGKGRGYIEYADGSIEKFGDWPTPEPEAAP